MHSVHPDYRKEVWLLVIEDSNKPVLPIEGSSANTELDFGIVAFSAFDAMSAIAYHLAEWDIHCFAIQVAGPARGKVIEVDAETYRQEQASQEDGCGDLAGQSSA